MDIASGLAAASQALQIARGLRELDKAYDQVTLKGQIIDLMDKLQDVRGALQDAREALTERDALIAQLRSAKNKKEAAIEKNGYLYREDPLNPGEPTGYPYCRRCDEVDGRMVLCTESEKGRYAVCPQCKAHLRDGYSYS